MNQEVSTSEEPKGRYIMSEPGLTTFVLKDALHKLREFEGTHIASASTESDSPRWTTMDLYKTGDGRYVLHTIGHSVIFHGMGSPCNSGTQTEPLALPMDAEPCAKCRPPAQPTGPVNLENPLIKLAVCENVDEVHRYLTHTDRKTNVVSVSHVAQRLLMDAARNDSAFDPDSPAQPL
jgi:hypothetical protein